MADQDDESPPLLARMARDPLQIIAVGGLYVGGAVLLWPYITGGIGAQFLFSPAVAATILAVSLLILVSGYLGIFTRSEPSARSSANSEDKETRALLREVRNYLAHSRPSSTPPTQVNIDDDFKGQLLARLTTESQNALSSFVEGEVFKKAAESDQKQQGRNALLRDVDQMLTTYQSEMGSWRRNANVNLLIGLGCAVAGIGVMWQTLATLAFEVEPSGTWRISDLYRVLSRFGLVLIIESVAFFFLKLYREDRSMIRYLRNEITNLEARYLSLKTALTFGTPADLTKVLQSLSATERNFLIKKGDRVISDITYENSEIMLEKILARFPELLGKGRPTSNKANHE
jgi:hypothetical protein